MGSNPSKCEEEKAEEIEYIRKRLYQAMERSNIALPNFSIDKSLITYSGLQSNQSLKNNVGIFLSKLSPTRLRDLFIRLAPFTPFANAVGLGAFLVSWWIEDLISQGSTPSGDAALLRRVFAEEKMTEVKDLIQVYVDRFKLYSHNRAKLLEETTYWERKLGAQLTRVKNAALGGHMSAYALKIWVNGAAFHIQMLIHLARLQRGDGTTVKAAIDNYQREFSALVTAYKKYKADCIDFSRRAALKDPNDYSPEIGYDCNITDKETGAHVYIGIYVAYNVVHTIPEMYLCKLFKEDEQVTKIQSYFSSAFTNVDNLIAQDDIFLFPSPDVE